MKHHAYLILLFLVESKVAQGFLQKTFYRSQNGLKTIFMKKKRISCQETHPSGLSGNAQKANQEAGVQILYEDYCLLLTYSEIQEFSSQAEGKAGRTNQLIVSLAIKKSKSNSKQ